MIVVGSSAATSCRGRSGITLTEILISIMILGIGMVSLATLFPLGLLKLRDAARFSRSAYLAESASADLATRGLLAPSAVQRADEFNYDGTGYLDLSKKPATPYWHHYLQGPPTNAYQWHDPFTVDTPAYGVITTAGGDTGAKSTQGIPFAYDPLWRWQTGYYLDPNAEGATQAPEARFASGIGFVRMDPGDSGYPSAHGLQRLTNFNRPALTPASQYVPSVFVSPEDVVWQDANYKSLYPMAWGLSDPVTSATTVDSTPSPLVPDLSISNVYDAASNKYVNTYLPIEDWRYTWMFTGRQVSGEQLSQTKSTVPISGVTFDGEIVIFENRPFALDFVTSAIDGNSYPQAAGERVVEAVFGYSTQVVQVGTDSNNNAVGNGLGAGKTVLLRWPASTPDPEIKVGSWIADVTYERTLATSLSRFAYTPSAAAVMSPSTSGQRCHWYQVVKVNPAAPATGTLAFGANNGDYRGMIVNVATSLRALTPLNADGSPLHVNAALVSPHVVQVIPRTFTVN